MTIFLKIGDENSEAKEYQTVLMAREAIKNEFTDGAKIFAKVLRNNEIEYQNEINFAEFADAEEAYAHIEALSEIHIPVKEENA